MSADNGIYILETPTPSSRRSAKVGEYAPPTEYRVAHLQAVENVNWDNAVDKPSDDPDICIANAREMWANSSIFYERTSALEEADRLYRNIMNSPFPVLEYGISFIKIPRAF